MMGGECLLAVLIVVGVIVALIVIGKAKPESGDAQVREHFALYNTEARADEFALQHGGHLLEAIRYAFREMARTLDGQYAQVGEWGMPRVVFRHKDAEALVAIVQPGSDPRFQRTQLTFVRPGGFDDRVELAPQRMASEILRARGVEDLEIGDADFDARYVVKGGPAGEAKAFLSPAVRSAIDTIRRLGPDDNVVVSLNPQRLRIEKAPPFTWIYHYMEMVHASKELYDRAVALSDVKGKVDIVESGEGESPVCQVCGGEVRADRVVCARCATPHHSECWAFNQKCSTFGCGETRCTTA